MCTGLSLFVLVTIFCTIVDVARNRKMEDDLFTESRIESHLHDSGNDFTDHGRLLHDDSDKENCRYYVTSWNGHYVKDPSENWTITKPHYDVRERPTSDTGKKHAPVLAEFTAFANFIETVDEKEGEIIASLFFKTRWVDNRVRPLQEIQKETPVLKWDHVSFPSEIKEQLWVPDLYIPMARHVVVPTIHQPAETIRVFAKNNVEYSAFFLIAFKCQLNYSYYPMDEQDCNLDIMSYSHTNKEVRLEWSKQGLQGMRTSNTKNFLVSIYRPRHNSRYIQHDGLGERDVLRIKFRLERYHSFHVIQTYLPSGMLVLVGWFSLLVPLDFAYGRMVLSVTTLLILVSIVVTTSQNTPGVNEVKAQDVWLFTCIFFVFSAIINCIADLRLLSMVEKESQIAGESEAAERVPIVDEKLRRDSQAGRESATVTLAAPESKYSVLFLGRNTPFQADKETLIASPAVIKWLRLAILLERGMTIAYPALFVLFVACYLAVYLSGGSEKAIFSADHE